MSEITGMLSEKMEFDLLVCELFQPHLYLHLLQRMWFTVIMAEICPLPFGRHFISGNRYVEPLSHEISC